MTTIYPLGSRVLLQDIEPSRQTAGGLYLPDSAKKKNTRQAIVLATGQGFILESGQKIPLTVQVGDTVIYNRIGCTEVEVNGKELIIVNENDIYGILK